ncbi:MAG: 2-phospho-L-lactate guanylyltransferase [Myxococcota bacterium]
MPSAEQGCTWAVVPVKGFARGKTRLRPRLPESERTRFARHLFDHVTTVLRDSPVIRGVLVLTEDDGVAVLAREMDLRVLRDPPSDTTPRLARVVDRGVEQVWRLGADKALICMADLPLLDVADVAHLATAAEPRAVVLAPDRKRAGTNALCLSRSTGWTHSCFGRADSFTRHLARAQRLGLDTVLVERRGLCFDVDEPADLVASNWRMPEGLANR